MEPTHSLQGYKIALLIDFDNVILGVDDPGFDVELVVNALRSRGQVVMGRAYGDWYRHNRHRRKLMEHGIELVETPVFGPVIKNSADIRIVLDGFEIAMLQQHIDAFCLVSGDSDFLPLIKKLQYLGKHVIVVSGNKFTSDLVRRNCNEFISYENLVAESLGATEDVSTLEGSFALLSRGILTLHERGMEVRSSTVKQMMLQLNPAFSERNFSCPQFKQFLDKAVKAGIVKLGGRDTQSGEFMVFLPGDFDDENGAPEVIASGKAPVAASEKRPTRERRPRRGAKDETPETLPASDEPAETAPISPVELGASAASEIESPALPAPTIKDAEVRPLSSEHLLNRGMRRGRLRFSGKERRAQIAANNVASVAAPAEDAAPEMAIVEPETTSEAMVVKADETLIEAATVEEVPELIAEAVELAPELVDMAPSETEAATETTEEAPATKKRATRRGGRGKGKKATAEKADGETETAEATVESVTDNPSPAEVQATDASSDEVSTPEVALENSAVSTSSASDEKPKARRRIVSPAPRRRPAAKKKQAE